MSVTLGALRAGQAPLYPEFLARCPKSLSTALAFVILPLLPLVCWFERVGIRARLLGPPLFRRLRSEFCSRSVLQRVGRMSRGNVRWTRRSRFRNVRGGGRSGGSGVTRSGLLGGGLHGWESDKRECARERKIQDDVTMMEVEWKAQKRVEKSGGARASRVRDQDRPPTQAGASTRQTGALGIARMKRGVHRVCRGT